MNQIEKVPSASVGESTSSIKSWHVYALISYYMILLIASIGLIIFLIWGKYAKPSDNELIVLMAFLMTGAVVGSVLYQIRILFDFYTKNPPKFNLRWMGKYITAPVEAMGLSLAILSLIQGGAVVLGGGSGIDFAQAKPLAIFGFGTLVGFGIREVIGWLASLARATFSTASKTEKDSKTDQ